MHRDRRLGRGARDFAIDEAVDHHVTDAGDALAGGAFQKNLQGGKVHELCFYAPATAA
jgi:hypothetical protein